MSDAGEKPREIKRYDSSAQIIKDNGFIYAEPQMIENESGEWIRYSAVEAKDEELSERCDCNGDSLSEKPNLMAPNTAEIKPFDSKQFISVDFLGGEAIEVISKDDHLSAMKAKDEQIKHLTKKCKNLDEIIGSLDVRDPNACDALLNVQLINQETIEALKKKLDKARAGFKRIISECCDDLIRNTSEQALKEIE